MEKRNLCEEKKNLEKKYNLLLERKQWRRIREKHKRKKRKRREREREKGKKRERRRRNV